jgi:immediate early response 3-interacting protein 1
VTILSEDRFLARINLSRSTYDPAFGAGPDSQSAKAKIVSGIESIRLVARGMLRLSLGADAERNVFVS